jgi:enoyl-CoA hydratase/carnithine racemase
MNVTARVENGLARLVISAPEDRNALDVATVKAMRAALSEVRGRPDLRMLLLESDVDKVFSLGMNLTKLGNETDPGAWKGYHSVANFVDFLIDLATMPVPTLAVVDGVAAAGGVELACVCDMIIGTTNASFSIAQLRKGIFPFITSTVLVPRIGQSRFLHWALSGVTMPARRLFDLGLINQLCEPSERDRVVSVFADRVLSFDSETLRAGISALRAEDGNLRARIRHAHSMFALNCIALSEKAGHAG